MEYSTRRPSFRNGGPVPRTRHFSKVRLDIPSIFAAPRVSRNEPSVFRSSEGAEGAVSEVWCPVPWGLDAWWFMVMSFAAVVLGEGLVGG